MSEFVKVLDSSSLPVGAARCVEVEGEKVALFNVGGHIHAIGDTCTHRGGPLSEGQVVGTEVTCPWHGAKFDIETGAAKGPPATESVKRYEARVDGDEIQIASE